VLFISIDDLRPELGCYGNAAIHTPSIDALARQSVVFTNTYCQAAVCAPSRASLMTGLRPDSTRVWHLGERFREIHPGIVTIPQYFGRHGYYTVSMGKIFHNYMPDSVSWDEPDLRPSKYGTPDMVDRDAETFYYDGDVIARQAETRARRIAANPKYVRYANGWNCGPAYEDSEAPDSAFYDGAQTDLAIATLRRLRERNQPFFLAVGFYRPHLPFVVPRKYWDLYNRDSIPPARSPGLPTDMPPMAINSMYELRGYDGFDHVRHPLEGSLTPRESRLLKHGYYASVSYIDACVGRLLGALDELGLSGNTIVVLWGDHGWKLGEHNSWGKMTNFDIDTRVPLIIRAPGHPGAGSHSDALTELVDIYPTLCELAGLDVPQYLQGSSLTPLLEEPGRQWKDAVFSQYHRRPKETPDGGRYMGYSMHTRAYHYVEWRTWDDELKQSGELVATELYDRAADPDESHNLAGLASRRSVIDSLARRLHRGWRVSRPEG
jgi:iduronate 2-sulfatase